MSEPNEQAAPQWGDQKPMNMNLVTSAAIEILEDLLRNDPEAVSALLRRRVRVSDATADHPHLVVNERSEIGGLGLINGILSRLQAPKVAMTIDENVVTGFSVYTN